jgi:CBS domain-containing protein
MTNTKISEILKTKGSEVYTVEASEPIVDAAHRMVEKKVGSLIVTEGNRIAGIVSERDCLRHLADRECPPEGATVYSIMTREIVAVRPETSAQECMAIMTQQRCRHLPVAEGDKLVGLVSIGDLVKQAAQDRRAEIHYLTEYIMGNYPGVEARGTSVFTATEAPV